MLMAGTPQKFLVYKESQMGGGSDSAQKQLVFPVYGNAVQKDKKERRASGHHKRA